LVVTRCTEHSDGRRREPVKEHLRNIFVETRIIGDQTTIVRCRRRYVRETDSFVDVDPALLSESRSRENRRSISAALRGKARSPLSQES
jgi:predicted RNA-binding protein